MVWAGMYMGWSGFTALMTRMEMVTETLVIFNQLKWLIALEDFINKKWYYEMCCVPT
jgi:hypothetical protein